MRVWIRLSIVVIGLVAGSGSVASDAVRPIDPAWADRYYVLIDELRCLVCQNQNLAESNAPLATDLREEVKEMLAEGQSDREIKRFLTDRYGDFVLYRPPFKPATWLLWLGPFLVLGLAFLMVARVARQSRATDAVQGPPSADHGELSKILDEEER